jgi:hypothetical protein
MSEENWKGLAIFALIFLGVTLLFSFLMIGSIQNQLMATEMQLTECLKPK